MKQAQHDLLSVYELHRINKRMDTKNSMLKLQTKDKMKVISEIKFYCAILFS